MISSMRRLALVVALAMSSLLPLTATPAGAQSSTTPAGARSPAPASPAAPSPLPIGDVTVLIVLLRHADGVSLTPDDLTGAAAVIEARLAALPAPGAQVTPIPDDRVRIDVADPTQFTAVRRVATAPGQFRIVAIPPDRVGGVQTGRPLPDDATIAVIVPPGHVAHAMVASDVLGQPAVDITLDPEASEAFDAWAAHHIGETTALVLDDEVVTLATINAPRFDGRVQVSGLPDEAQAHGLAAILTGGPLPVTAEPLTICPAPAPCPVPSPGPTIPSPGPGPSGTP